MSEKYKFPPGSTDPRDHCLDCGAPLIPCTCQPDCPGAMCSNEACRRGLDIMPKEDQ